MNINTAQNPNHNYQSFKGLKIAFEDLKPAKKLLKANGYEIGGHSVFRTMFPIDADTDFFTKATSKTSRKSIESDNTYNIIDPSNYENVYFIAKNNTETNIKNLLDKAKIFVTYLADL